MPSALTFAFVVLPPAYVAAVARLRKLALVVDFYRRPAAKSGWNEESRGTLLREQRHVQGETMQDHFASATRTPLPQPEFDEQPPADLMAAVEACVLNRDDIRAWRAARVLVLREVEASLRPIGRALVERMCPASARIASHMNLAFMAACIDAIGWPDYRAVERWVHGHTIVGEIPDTGLFRPLEQPFECPADVLSPASNRAWNKSLQRSVQSLATGAEGDDAAIVHEVEKLTRKELSEKLVRGPFTLKQLEKRFGDGKCRVQRRFGVDQGTKDDGSRKVRGIDNARAASLIRRQWCHETIVCISIAFVAMVARLFQFFCARLGIQMLRLLLGLDDMRAAYRRVPTWQQWYTVFAIWSFTRSRVELYYLDGHNFGHRSAVLNFNAFPHLVVALCRVLLAVPVDHFFDDYLIVDLALASLSGTDGISGQEGLAVIHELLGQMVEPKKRKPMAGSNVALGIDVDVSRVVQEHAVFASATETRIVKVLATLTSAKRQNFLPPSLASRVRGVLNFIFSSAAASFGRAALQPLAQREHRDTSFEFVGTPLEDMLVFLEFILWRLPELRLPLQRDSRSPKLIYTDAMYNQISRLLRVAFFVWCPVLCQAFHSHMELSSAYLDTFISRELKQLIAQGEGVARLLPLFSMPEFFFGQTALGFVDNTYSLSAFVHGYASKPDMGYLVNAYSTALFTLQLRCWDEWIPSAANISDLPSRLKYDEYLRLFPDSIWVDPVLPDLTRWGASLAQLQDVLRSRGTSLTQLHRAVVQRRMVAQRRMAAEQRARARGPA